MISTRQDLYLFWFLVSLFLVEVRSSLLFLKNNAFDVGIAWNNLQEKMLFLVKDIWQIGFQF